MLLFIFYEDSFTNFFPGDPLFFIERYRDSYVLRPQASEYEVK